ncbi:MAG: hypothetical protein KAH00_06750 [Cocleimonas sp.]|nr:hypothetical protein [Cocleimonas sp.]
MMLLFTGLTLFAAIKTYSGVDVNAQSIHYQYPPSIRSGSSSSAYASRRRSSGYSSGGYRGGK